jgi:hypothetical protein
MQRSIHAAATRAAQAALPRPSQDQDFDRYLILDDSDDDFGSHILTVFRERERLNQEALS